MIKKLLVFVIIFSVLAMSSCDAAQSETSTDPANEESTVLPGAPSNVESTKDDEAENTASENVTDESEKPTKDDKGENTVSENMTEESEEPTEDDKDEDTVSENVTEESEEPTEEAEDTAYPTEPASDMPKDETVVENVEIPELNADRLPFTMEFTDTAYTTKSDRINFHIRAKQPGPLGRGDKWRLYKIDGDKVTLAGEIMWDIAIDYEAKSEDEYIERDGSVSIKTLCGKETLEAGQYCLIFYIQVPDENGYYHSASGATLYFEVKEDTEIESESETKKETVAEIETNEMGIPEYPSDRLAFTMELVETVYTTSSEKITYRIKSKEPAEYVSMGEKWKLYRIEGNNSTIIGETKWDTSVSFFAESGKDHVDRECIMFIKTLCGKKPLEVGKYCLVYYETYPSVAGIAMYFEVVE